MRRRKTIVIVIGLLLAAAALAAVAVYQGIFLITSAKRPQDQYHLEIPAVSSQNDTDGDGIDDQRDILNGAVSYVKTHPKYKSKYYTSGYPDDGYGVCTDVVAFALRAAGIDLMAEVQQDIERAPQDYDIDSPDENIDFRRVKNLKVYFAHTAESYTLDVRQVEEWQGGDIVIFKNHIGIISDRRNEEGIPYVIHHNDPMQKNYEEDILGERDDIVGHYRLP